MNELCRGNMLTSIKGDLWWLLIHSDKLCRSHQLWLAHEATPEHLHIQPIETHNNNSDRNSLYIHS